MKEGWEYKKLGEICQSDLGKTLNKSKDKGELYPYLCAINILWNKIELSTLKQTRFEKDELERYSVKKGDLLICEGGDIGRAAIWDKEESILYQNALHRVRFEDNMNARFCLLFLQNLKHKGILDNRYGKGVTIKHLVKSALLSIPIPVPTLSEQQHVVEELDLLSSIIEKKKAQLNELDNLAQSLFYEMFGESSNWERKPLKEITTKMGSGATPRGGNQSYKEDGVSLIRSLNVHNGYFKYDDLAHIDELQASQLDNVTIKNNDVLLNITGASVARCCIVPSDILPARVNQHVSILRVKENLLNSIYLCHCLISPNSQAELLIMSKSNAATREALPKAALEKYLVPVPPLDLQNQFASKIEAIEHQKELIKQSIKEVETLFNSRMDYYFN